MRRLQARGLFAALENEDLEVPTEVIEAPVEAEVPNHAESVEADLADLNAEHADIEAHDAEIDEAEETVEALEAIRDSLIEADAEGGLSKSGARILKISLEHMYGRIGMSTAKVMPALESFGGDASRQETTQIALEEVSDVIKKVWQAIVDAATKAWEWIKGWYNKLFDTNTKLVNRAKALAEAAPKATGEPKSETIDNAGLAKALMLPGEGGSIDHVLAGLEKFAGEFTGGAGKYFANITKLLDSVKAGEVADLKPEEMSLGLTHLEGGAASKLGLKVAAGASIFASDALPGGKYFVSAWGGTTDSSFVGIVDHAESHDSKALPVLNEDAIKKVAAAVASVSSKVESTKTDLDAAGKALEALITAGKKHMEAGDVNQDDQSKAAVQLARTCHKLITGAATQANDYLVKTCQSLLAWGELSVRAHTGTALGNAAEKVGEKAGEAADKVKEAAGKVGDAAKDAAGKVKEAAGKAGTAVKDAAGKVADKTKEAVNKAATKTVDATKK